MGQKNEKELIIKMLDKISDDHVIHLIYIFILGKMD